AGACRDVQFPPIMSGSHMLTLGKYVMMISARNSGTSQGRIAIVVRSTDSFDTRASTNSTMPSGGCSRPIIRFRVMTRPKWIGSMPSFSTSGNRMGTRMVMAAMVSMKQPTTRISRFASSRNTHLLCVTARMASVSVCAAWVVVSSHANTEAAVTMNSTDAVVSMVSKVALASVRSVIERYRTRPRNSAQITAATAASVGVNQPMVMPPMRITGAIKAMTAEKSKYQSAASNAANAISVAMLADTPKVVMSQMLNGNASTTSTSTVAPPSRFQSNGT